MWCADDGFRGHPSVWIGSFCNDYLPESSSSHVCRLRWSYEDLVARDTIGSVSFGELVRTEHLRSFAVALELKLNYRR